MDSSDLVRTRTDEHVLRALMEHRRLTRAELATTIDISRPTAGESVRRLTERGLVADTGERTPGGRGRGRVGSYYALSPQVGTALAVSIAPEGVVAEAVDAYGDTVASASASVAASGPASASASVAAVQVNSALRTVGASVTAAGVTPRLAVVSAADPVDRATGRLVQLPDSPFLVGALDPVELLSPYVTGPITVDNDVNWAARAEKVHTGLTDFAYLYLGEGLGCAVVADGEVKRGATGLAGEIAHLITTGPSGAATHLIDVFATLNLRRPAATAIDVPRLLSAPPEVHRAVAQAIAGVLAAIVALADPSRIVLGGPWGPALLPAITDAFAGSPRRTPLHPAAVTGNAALAGARAEALTALRAAVAVHARQ